MNKNLMYLVIGLLLLVGLVGAIILQIVRPEALGAFVQHVLVIVGLGVSAAGTIYGLGQVNDRVAQVEENTNGRMSELIEHNKQLTRLVESTSIVPVQKPKED